MSIMAKVTRHGPMTFVGRVTKAGVMNKTVTVTVDRIWEHPKTHKRVTRSSKFLVHDPENNYRIEDRVRIVNVPRFSKHKAFEVQALIERGWEGQQADKTAATEESVRRQEENSERRQAWQLKTQAERAKAKAAKKAATKAAMGTPSGSPPSAS